MKLLVTGANGFIGKALVQELLASTPYELNLVTRDRSVNSTNDRINYFFIEDIATQECWQSMLKECDLVIHTAARVHVLQDKCEDPLSEFRRVNVTATMNLARQALQQGVKRFIFLSSIGVYGSKPQTPIDENSILNPQTPYARSKLEVENELFNLAKSTNMEIVIIRPPLVYAEDAPGNFANLLSLISKKIILPFGSIANQRSFISKENLVDFICCCIHHPLAKNEAFVIADEESISTPELITYLRKGMALSKGIIPFPLVIIKGLCKILGKDSLFQQLSGSLIINNSKAKALLNWQPKEKLYTSLLKVGFNYKKNV